MSILIDYFRKMTQESNKNELKGYKVTNVERTRRFGVACRNLQELKRKACAKFNIANDEQESVAICLVDGTQIDDDYFMIVEPQTTLIIQRRGEKLLSDADILYNTLRQVNLEFITTGDVVRRFLSKNLKTKIAVLNKALNKDDTKTGFSSRDDHPEWFKHLDTTANTKEVYMHRRCQDRIRSYLYKTIAQIKNSEIYTKNEISRRHLNHAVSFFKLQLRQDHCFGFYFDRSYAEVNKKLDNNFLLSSNDVKSEKLVATDESDSNFNHCYDHCPCKIGHDILLYSSKKILEEFFTSDPYKNEPENDFENNVNVSTDVLDARKMHSPAKRAKDHDDARDDHCPYKIRDDVDAEHRLALCDANGEFHCDGVWNADRCSYGERHQVNPYRSYEELVVFSTWNFDHRIERSRTLIPELLKASEKATISQKDIIYFYDNIFTIKNLRLVHIICHDKGAHKQ